MLSVTIFYVALVLWCLLLVWSIHSGKWLAYFVYGLAFTAFLNGRYVIEGVEGGIMFFTGIFDVVAHIGVPDDNQGAAFASCPDNACSVLTQ